jgi:toxin ParE1/3/4
MEEATKLPVKVSREFNFDIDQIYAWGIETFGTRKAEFYENEIWKLVEGQSNNWPFFSECRHLPTKSKMYRWIILESHLIIYCITASEIQVIRIIHSHRSATKIKTTKNIAP